MGVIQRGDRLSHYVSYRLRGQVVTLNFGSGPLAEQRAVALAGELAEGRDRIARIKAKGRASRQTLADEATALDDRADRACRLAALAMEGAGYHRHKRGEWRKARKMAEPGKDLAVTDHDLQAHYDSMRAGRPGAEQKAHDFLEVCRKDAPEFLRVLLEKLGGDPAARAEDDLIARHAGDNLLRREATKEWLGRFKADLAGPGPVTGLERVLIDEAGLAYLAYHEAASRARRTADPELLKVSTAEFFQRLEERAHKRFIRVVKALDQVRRKAVPALQVNIAGERVGVMVAGPAAGEPAGPEAVEGPGPDQASATSIKPSD